MTEQFLDDAEVSSAAEEVGGETVPHKVGVHMGLETGAGGVLIQELADTGRGEFSAADREEDFPSGAFGDKGRSFAVEVGFDRATGGFAKRNQAGFASLPRNADKSGFEVDILEAGIAKLRNPESAGVEQLKDGPIPESQRVIWPDAIDEALDLGDMQRGGQVFLRAGQSKVLCGIGANTFASDQESKKNPDRHGIDTHRGGFEPSAFAVHQKIRDILRLQEHPLPVWCVGFNPSGKCLQRALNHHLIALGKPTLGGEIHEEFLERSGKAGRDRCLRWVGSSHGCREHILIGGIPQPLIQPGGCFVFFYCIVLLVIG